MLFYLGGDNLLSVTKNGQSEPIADIKNLLIDEEVFTSETGNRTISFIALNSDNNQHAYPLLEEESLVEYDGHEYRIKTMNESRFQKNITAIHTLFDLVGERKYTINGGTKTLNEAATWTLEGTGWTFEIDGISKHELLANYGNDNVLSLLKTLCAAFDCEIEIAPNKHIIFRKTIGEDNDFQFRYKHNIKTIKKKVDTTNLATVIKGIGGNGLEVTYESPNKSVFGEIHAEPFEDDRITQSDTMLIALQRELNDNPDVTLEVEEVVLGYSAGLGDKVWTIYEPLGIEFQQRVIGRKTYPHQKGKNTVILGTRKKQLSDLLTETNIKINRNNKQVQSRIEQTNERITLEVEEIEGSLSTLEVSVGQIQSTVSGPGGLESQITQLSGEISSRVTAGEVESIFYQTANSFTFDADQINFNGHVFGQGATFEGNIETYDSVQVGNNVYLGSRSNTSSEKAVWFNNLANIRTTPGIGFAGLRMEASDITIDAVDIGLSGDVAVYGDLRVTGTLDATVSYATSAGGTNYLGGSHYSNYSRTSHNHDGRYPTNIGSATVGLEISASDNLAVYRNGSYVGWININ